MSVTVPVELVPPATEFGLKATLDTTIGVTAKVAVTETPLAPAEIVAVAADVTVEVFTEKVAVVAPAATVTLAGTVAAELFDSNFTA